MDETSSPNTPILTTANELHARLARDGPMMTIVDARSTAAFANGHIPGAIPVDLWAMSLSDTDPAPLDAFLWMIQHVLEARGVSTERPIVVYEETSGMRAARVFWFLEYFGACDVRLLDGGFRSWVAEGLPVEKIANEPKTTEWTANSDARVLATWRDVRDGLGRENVTILDTRSDEEYSGALVRAKRAGAIPGAVHIEWTQNLTPEGKFKAPADLGAMYAGAGVTPDKEVITYCQGGYRAAHSYIALRLLGYPRVKSYLGSWKEWGDRMDLPIEIPK